jgi:hypothetical protein
MPEDEQKTVTSICRNCKRQIGYDWSIKDEWTHGYGGTYCLDRNGFTATPLAKAEPVLETETL